MWQVPYKPNDITVTVSAAQVPDRLDVGWKSPSADAATQLFATIDEGEIARKQSY